MSYSISTPRTKPDPIKIDRLIFDELDTLASMLIDLDVKSTVLVSLNDELLIHVNNGDMLFYHKELDPSGDTHDLGWMLMSQYEFNDGVSRIDKSQIITTIAYQMSTI